MSLWVGWMSYLLVGDLILGWGLILLGLLLGLGFGSGFAKFFGLAFSTVPSTFQVEGSVYRGFVVVGGLVTLGLGLGGVAFLAVAAGGDFSVPADLSWRGLFWMGPLGHWRRKWWIFGLGCWGCQGTLLRCRSFR